MKKLNEMTGIEKIAYKNIKGIFNWNVGGWYNDACCDNNLEYVPNTAEEAKQIIYEDALENAAGEGWYQCKGAPREMRFAGAEFIKDVINHLWNKDGDVLDIGAVKNW